MDSFVTAAFVGTAQQSNIETSTGTAVDALTQRIVDGEVEHKLLLSAGAWALYRQAGTVAEKLTTSVQPAAPEILPLCTPGIAVLVENMVKGEYSNLLPEALARMQRAGQRVPHRILATLLNVQDAGLRRAIYPVLGQRGFWLSQFNTAWSWVWDYQSEELSEGLAQSESESLWQEGTLGQRVSVLRQLRSRDTAQARAWLAKVWAQEKAEARSKLLDTLEVGLSLDDEDTLEKALDDRAGNVRVTATSLLLRLPTSAFGKRMQARAHIMLNYATGKLTVTLPATLPKDWVRDGIVAKNDIAGVSEHVWWFTQVVMHVPPSYWEEQFGAPVSELIEATDSQEDWHETLLNAWSGAAHVHNDAQWCTALWDYWSQKQSPITRSHAELLTHIPQAEAEQRVSSLFNDRENARQDWHYALSALPTQWSKNFSETYLQKLRHHIVALDFRSDSSVYNDSWYRSIESATLALSPDCFAGATQTWTVPEVPDEMAKHAYWRQYWVQELKKFVQTIRIRQRLIEEIVV